MAGILWFLVCTVFNLCWGGHSQVTQEKDCKRGRNIAINSVTKSCQDVSISTFPYAYIMSKFSQAVRYIIYTLWLIDTFKDIKPAWPVLAQVDP